jgi:imidazolonepropionase-like amidohydrolase
VWVNQLGVPPIDAIRAATYWPAVAMKAERDYGTVAEGKYADFIAVRGDLLKHITLLQHVDLVIKHASRSDETGRLIGIGLDARKKRERRPEAPLPPWL